MVPNPQPKEENKKQIKNMLKNNQTRNQQTNIVFSHLEIYRRIIFHVNWG